MLCSTFEVVPKAGASKQRQMSASSVRSIPLVVLTGFLASGKSTFLDAVLHDVSKRQKAPRVCVILNEFAEHGIGVANELDHAHCAVARVELHETARYVRNANPRQPQRIGCCGSSCAMLQAAVCVAVDAMISCRCCVT